MANKLEILGEASKVLVAAVAADEDQRGGATKLLSSPKRSSTGSGAVALCCSLTVSG